MLFALACCYVGLGVVVMVFQAAVVKFDRTKLPKDMFPRSWMIALGFVVGVGFYHLVMIERTKAEIRRYIFHGSSDGKPEFRCHLIGPEFVCLAAVSKERAVRYGSTAATGFDDPDPRIRARALRATLFVKGIWGADSQAPQKVIRHARHDTASEVQEVLKEFYGDDWREW